MKKKLTVSLIQMDIKTAMAEKNFETAADLIEKAGRYKPDFIVLPEMWSTGFAYLDLHGIAKRWSEETMDFIKYHARRSSAVLIAGSVPEVSEKKVYNTCFVADPSGEISGKYRKTHSFSPTGENTHFANGETADALETGFGKIGVIICYDLRFPELSRKLWTKGINMLFVPAQFPSVRIDHWLTLLKARAIENHIFTIGCNRVGKDKRYEYPGESVVFDPFGNTVEKAGGKECVMTCTIDPDKIKEANERIPIQKDRRPEVYK
ncbi:MAG: carbon-nitrogen family hydrolase [Candidatus Saganbacteria bacterium]|nr:carbon-nitrogen family hydrolase [Candidatus Saganbacteria bacterium]